MEDKRYYWCKLKRDFFKRHDMRILEAMNGGKAYLLIYLKLLCEALDHDGRLRFSDRIAYTPKMLAAITDESEDTVQDAVEAFQSLGLITVETDGTYYMDGIERMIGSESSDAERKRKKREENRRTEQCPNHSDIIPKRADNVRQRTDNVQECPDNVRQGAENVRQSIEYRDKSKSIDNNNNNTHTQRVCAGASARKGVLEMVCEEFKRRGLEHPEEEAKLYLQKNPTLTEDNCLIYTERWARRFEKDKGASSGTDYDEWLKIALNNTYGEEMEDTNQ